MTQSKLLTTVLLLLAVGLIYGLVATDKMKVRAQGAGKGNPIIVGTYDLQRGRLVLVDHDLQKLSLYKLDDKGLKLYCTRSYIDDMNVEDTSPQQQQFMQNKGTIDFVKEFNNKMNNAKAKDAKGGVK